MSSRTRIIVMRCAVAVAIIFILALLGACSTQATGTPSVTKTVTVTVTATPPPTTVAPVQTPPQPLVSTPSATAPSAPAVAPAPTATSTKAARSLRIPVLKNIGAKCPLAVRGDYPPAFNDGGQSLAFIGDIAAYLPTKSAIQCAQGRLHAGGFMLLTAKEQLQESPTMKTPNYPGTFHVIWARIGNNNKPECILPFTIMDYEGNISLFKDGQPVGMDRDGVNMVNWSAQQIRQQVQVAFDNC